MSRYIHELPNWPSFRWNYEAFADKLATVRHQQGRLLGRMESFGFNFRQESLLKTLTQDVVKTSEIEGDLLDTEQHGAYLLLLMTYWKQLGPLADNDRDRKSTRLNSSH